MYHVTLRRSNRERRKLGIRAKVFGTTKRPRLSVFRSSTNIYAQVIDDEKGVTIAEYSSAKIKDRKNKTKVQESFEVGKELAKEALEKNVKNVVFDRGGYKYHGRVKALADGAREGGLEL